jgi:hypothetical protein
VLECVPGIWLDICNYKRADVCTDLRADIFIYKRADVCADPRADIFTSIPRSGPTFVLMPTSVSKRGPTSAMECVPDIWLDICTYKSVDIDIEKRADICTHKRANFYDNKRGQKDSSLRWVLRLRGGLQILVKTLIESSALADSPTMVTCSPMVVHPNGD